MSSCDRCLVLGLILESRENKKMDGTDEMYPNLEKSCKNNKTEK
jgi:hypothetical protein